MPELPEVETVRRGLAPTMEGFVIKRVILNRPDLRFPFPTGFIRRLEGQKIITLNRRAKFLNAKLSSRECLLMHLGMSGRFTIHASSEAAKNRPLGHYVHDVGGISKHDHVIFEMSSGYHIIYNDPRRFGFMELVPPHTVSRLDKLGPEPLSNDCHAPYLRSRLAGRKSKIKAALLDQDIIAGLGNIYVCEALFRAGILPTRQAGDVTEDEADCLLGHIKDVLTDAIEAGGSSLRDFAQADGDLGYFQHQFDVYGREDEPCHICDETIIRISQSGRSSFYCPTCQI